MTRFEQNLFCVFYHLRSLFLLPSSATYGNRRSDSLPAQYLLAVPPTLRPRVAPSRIYAATGLRAAERAHAAFLAARWRRGGGERADADVAAAHTSSYAWLWQQRDVPGGRTVAAYAF